MCSDYYVFPNRVCEHRGTHGFRSTVGSDRRHGSGRHVFVLEGSNPTVVTNVKPSLRGELMGGCKHDNSCCIQIR